MSATTALIDIQNHKGFAPILATESTKIDALLSKNGKLVLIQVPIDFDTNALNNVKMPRNLKDSVAIGKDWVISKSTERADSGLLPAFFNPQEQGLTLKSSVFDAQFIVQRKLTDVDKFVEEATSHVTSIHAPQQPDERFLNYKTVPYGSLGKSRSLAEMQQPEEVPTKQSNAGKIQPEDEMPSEEIKADKDSDGIEMVNSKEDEQPPRKKLKEKKAHKKDKSQKKEKHHKKKSSSTEENKE